MTRQGAAGRRFREPAAAEAGGYVLALAGLVVAVSVAVHPLPVGGFREDPGILAGTPWWGLIHVLIAAGFVGLVIDGTRSIANGAVMFTPFGEVAYRVFGERYLLLQPAIERHVHPVLWDPVVLNLTLLPASVVAFFLGVLLLWLGQKRPESIGFATGR